MVRSVELAPPASHVSDLDAYASLLPEGLSVAVLLPCYNEVLTVAKVVAEFRAALPGADIYVYDNNSTDGSYAAAEEAGAIVRREYRQGKGHVIRRMFADVEADIYVMADADDTYDASAAPLLVARMVEDNLDLLNGARQTQMQGAYRPGHRFGNLMLTSLVRHIFGQQFHDMLSGYKICSRRFVKSFAARSSGFETETELTVHALELFMPCAEVTTRYGERPVGSSSKLRTFRDGFQILITIGELIRSERPLQFFSFVSLLAFGSALVLGAPILETYLEIGEVPRFPTAFLVVGLSIVAVLSFFTGLILDLIATTRRDLKHLAYLGIASSQHRRPATTAMPTSAVVRIGLNR